MKTSTVIGSLTIQFCIIAGWFMMPDSDVKSIFTAMLVGFGIASIVNPVVLRYKED